MKNIIQLGLLLTSTFSLFTEGTENLKQGMVHLNDVSTYYQCVGVGGPTIVIETGLGVAISDESETSWNAFIESVSKKNEVCFYDRAGIGKSSKTSMPQTSKEIAVQLNQLVSAAKLNAPFILVAHSMGGIHARVFNDMFPERVLGILLVDATPYGSDAWAYAEMSKLQPEDTEDYLSFKKQFVHRLEEPTTNAEMLNVLASVNQADNSQDFGNKPLAIIQRTMQYGTEYAPPFIPKEFENRWDNVYRDSEQVFTSLSTNSHFIRSSSKSHFLQLPTEDLEVTLKALDWVFEQLKETD
ncbi:alpha/beta fold hydrolase [Flavobacterium sp. W21_SRS_FM6]|uniref:alpha/beta fold hydrolase n=1 Tax=Flavobacterium sp. W21_SRS_FM6 TaxID=3240268 RepID=UPI003F8DE0FD